MSKHDASTHRALAQASAAFCAAALVSNSTKAVPLGLRVCLSRTSLLGQSHG